jgi:hypothetical protein
VYRSKFLVNSAWLIAAALILSGCGSTTTRVTKILHDPAFKKPRYSNILVIAVADSYDNRAQFERSLVSGIRKTGAEATAYYTVLGHNPKVTSNAIQSAIRSRKFDAVLFSRAKGVTEEINVKEGSASAQATAMGGSLFNLFQYDYEEHIEPENLRLSTNVILVTQMYAAAEQKNIWAIKSSSFDRESVGQIIDSITAAVVKQLNRDNMIGPK